MTRAPWVLPKHGDLANWHTGDPDAIPAVGGAMDLAVGARQVLVMMKCGSAWTST